MPSIGFIGMGNMGYAMLQGALQVFAPTEMVFTCAREEHRKEVWKDTGVNYAESNAECANSAKYIILAVKPQIYDQVLKNIEHVVRPEHVIISLAPGITTEYIKSKIGQDKRVVRAMPNTPALIGEGMTGVSYDASKFTFEEQDVLHKIFSSIGKYEKVDEKLMNAVVSASGSSPAFVYMFIEALADSVVKQGLPRDKAYTFVAQSVKGAAEMVLKTGKHPAELKDAVCSPGGTTIAAVAALEEEGFRNAVIKAGEACGEKAASFEK